MGGTYKNSALNDIGIFSFDFDRAITTGEVAAFLQIIKKLFVFKRYHDHGHKLLNKTLEV